MGRVLRCATLAPAGGLIDYRGLHRSCRADGPRLWEIRIDDRSCRCDQRHGSGSQPPAKLVDGDSRHERSHRRTNRRSPHIQALLPPRTNFRKISDSATCSAVQIIFAAHGFLYLVQRDTRAPAGEHLQTLQNSLGPPKKHSLRRPVCDILFG